MTKSASIPGNYAYSVIGIPPIISEDLITLMFYDVRPFIIIPVKRALKVIVGSIRY